MMTGNTCKEVKAWNTGCFSFFLDASRLGRLGNKTNLSNHD